MINGMKAEELMIGDWVYGIYKGIKYPSQVKKLDYDVLLSCAELPEDWDDDYEFDEIEPIPLTSEILKKNGFELVSKEIYVSYRSAGDGFIKIRLSDLLDGEWELYIDNYDKFNDSHTTLSIDRTFTKVHELQHALRLCGINKEIVL